jgi:hypothetical protein
MKDLWSLETLAQIQELMFLAVEQSFQWYHREGAHTAEEYNAVEKLEH